MGVNVAVHTRHVFLGSAPPPGLDLVLETDHADAN